MMAKKNTSPKKAHAQILERAGLNPLCWMVLQELSNSMIVKHRVTGEVKVIDK